MKQIDVIITDVYREVRGRLKSMTRCTDVLSYFVKLGLVVSENIDPQSGPRQ